MSHRRHYGYNRLDIQEAARLCKEYGWYSLLPDDTTDKLRKLFDSVSSDGTLLGNAGDPIFWYDVDGPDGDIVEGPFCVECASIRLGIDPETGQSTDDETDPEMLGYVWPSYTNGVYEHGARCSGCYKWLVEPAGIVSYFEDSEGNVTDFRAWAEWSQAETWYSELPESERSADSEDMTGWTKPSWDDADDVRERIRNTDLAEHDIERLIIAVQDYIIG